MGALWELASTPAAYAKKAFYKANDPERSTPPVRIDFGPAPLQHCMLWEPDVVRHEEVVFWFHGGGYLVGTAESMLDAANVYNAQGYRFCSVGFRLMPWDRFPAQVDDAFAGIAAALVWLEANGRPCERIFVGGSSCGGHLACLVGYGRWLQEAHGFPAERLAGVVSCAAVVDADDMLLRPFPAPAVWHAYMDLPTHGSDSRAARHMALLPYSPVALVERYAQPGGPGLGAPTPAPNPPTPVPFFAIHGRADTMSPYAHEAAFVRRLNEIAPRPADASPTATLHTVEDWRWQHMVTTVTLHKDPVDKSPALAALFAWLADK